VAQTRLFTLSQKQPNAIDWFDAILLARLPPLDVTKGIVKVCNAGSGASLLSHRPDNIIDVTEALLETEFSLQCQMNH